MPKMKTNRAAAKRFTLTAGGHVKAPSGGANHFMGNKRPNRLRRLRKGRIVTKAFEARIRRLFPYGLP